MITLIMNQMKNKSKSDMIKSFHRKNNNKYRNKIKIKIIKM